MPEKANQKSFSPYSYRKFYFFRFIILFLLIIMSIFLSSLFIHDLLLGKLNSWTQIIMPILILIIPVSSFPLVEEWVYQPWTKQARKLERQYIKRNTNINEIT